MLAVISLLLLIGALVLTLAVTRRNNPGVHDLDDARLAAYVAYHATPRRC